jgi:uncharacterized damage-inducible protein DinB
MSRRSVLMEALAATPSDLARMLRPVDAATVLARPTPDDWCVADVVAHLGYIEPLYLARLRRIAEQDNPYEPYMHPDASAHDLRRPLSELFDEFAARRAETLTFLAGLAQRDWGRPLVHQTYGPSKLRDQVQGLVTHDNDHLEQIVTLREQLEKRKT